MTVKINKKYDSKIYVTLYDIDFVVVADVQEWGDEYSLEDMRVYIESDTDKNDISDFLSDSILNKLEDKAYAIYKEESNE